MGHSKLPIVISLLSLLAAAGSVAAMFSMRATRSRDGSHVKAVTYQDDLSGARRPLKSIRRNSSTGRPPRSRSI